MKTYLTFDVGGSAIKYALIQEDLSILDKSSVPTPMDSLEHFVETIGEIYDRYASQISGIAISMPGIHILLRVEILHLCRQLYLDRKSVV